MKTNGEAERIKIQKNCEDNSVSSDETYHFNDGNANSESYNSGLDVDESNHDEPHDHSKSSSDESSSNTSSSYATSSSDEYISDSEVDTTSSSSDDDVDDISDHDESYDEEPLYKGSEIGLKLAYVLIVAFVLEHNLAKNA